MPTAVLIVTVSIRTHGVGVGWRGWGGGGLHVSKEREMKKERGADTSFHIMAKLGLPRFNLGKD